MLSGATMGTTYSIQVAGLTESDKTSLARAVEAELGAVNSAMSTYIPDSAISRFNRSRSTEWFEVPSGFVEVATEALHIAKASDGAFDPTVGPLVRRWGFGPDNQESPPTSQQLSAILESVGHHFFEIRDKPPAVRKTTPELEVDFSAIAKGYAVDQLAAIVREMGYRHYLVEIGGELSVSGYRAQDLPWRIGVEQPASDGTDIKASLALSGGGVASSGDYRNFREAGGRRISHIIDPRTGEPVAHGLAAVTVVANTTMHADGWATALMVLGAQRGMAVARRHSLAARFIEFQDGQFRVSASPLYRQLRTD